MLARKMSSCVCFLLVLGTLLTFFSTPIESARELSRHEFDNLLKNDNFLYVLFYTPKCYQCRKIFATWDKLEKQVLAYPNPKLVVGQVDCNVNRILCSREDIRDVPVIKLYTIVNAITQLDFVYIGDKFDIEELQDFAKEKISRIIIQGHPTEDEEEEDDESVADPEKYYSDRLYFSAYKKKFNLKRKLTFPSIDPLVSETSFDDLKNPKTNLKSVDGLYEVTDEDSALFYNEGEHFVNFYAPWCKHCQILEPVWTDLAKKMPPDAPLKMSRVDCTINGQTCTHFDIKEYPSILWISNGKVVTRYDGTRTYDSLKHFIKLQLLAVELGVHIIKLNQDIDEELLMRMIDDRKKKIFELNSDNFQMITGKGIILVHFTVPWSKHCRVMRPELAKLVTEIVDHGLALQVGMIDCSQNDDICTEAEVDGYPTLYLYKNGVRSPKEYLGERKAESFLEYILRSLNKKTEL